MSIIDCGTNRVLIPAFPYTGPAFFCAPLGLHRGQQDRLCRARRQVSGLIHSIKPAVAGFLEDMVEETVDILTRKLPASVVAK